MSLDGDGCGECGVGEDQGEAEEYDAYQDRDLHGSLLLGDVVVLGRIAEG